MSVPVAEAAAALVPYAMTKTDIAMYYSGSHTDNPNSGRILRRLGLLQTREEMNFSLAQQKEVPVMKMHLTRERWLPL